MRLTPASYVFRELECIKKYTGYSVSVTTAIPLRMWKLAQALLVANDLPTFEGDSVRDMRVLLAGYTGRYNEPMKIIRVILEKNGRRVRNGSSGLPVGVFYLNRSLLL